MRSSVSLLVCALLLVGGLSGCLGGSADKPAPATESAPAANATPNATLDPSMGNMDMSDVNKSTGAAPHIHDYWKGRERVTLMDSDISADLGSALRFTFADLARGVPAVGGAQFNLPDETIVYEGTGKMDITLTWTDPTVTGTGISWRNPAAPSTYSAPKDMRSGNTLTLDVTPDMCDMPHSKNSQWGFLLMPDSAGQVVYGKLHVKVDIVRMRDITLFPAHPDLWQGAHVLEIFKGAGSSKQSDPATSFVNFATKSSVDDSVQATHLVPMETISMTGNLTLTTAQVEFGKVANVYLLVKAANMQQPARAKLIKSDPANNVYQYAWLVDMRQADGAYAKQSNWRFDVQVTSDPTGTGSQLCGQGACTGDAKVDYTLVVEAYDAAVDGAAKLTNGGRGG